MSNIIDWILRLFGRKGKEELPETENIIYSLEPAPRQSASSLKVQTALSNLEGYNDQDWQRIVLDNKYWTCSKEAFQEIVDYNTLNEKQYILEQYDCDNFAFTFKAQVGLNHNLNNVGLVLDHSGGHAYNVVIFDDGTAELFEPQTDRWITPGESAAYSFTAGIIIL